MAVITRQTFANMVTEVTKRLGGHDYSGFDSRVKYWVTSTYYDLALTIHHFELDKSTTASLTSGTSSVSVPADTYLVVGVACPHATQPKRWLKAERYDNIRSKHTLVAGRP